MMNVEVSYSASKNNETLSIKVAEQMETKNDAKIQAMKDVINAFAPPGQQGQIEASCSPNALPPASVSASGKRPDSSKKISSSQINFLLKLLDKHRIPVPAFCQQNGIGRIEDLSMSDAQDIIAELKTN